MEQLFIVSRIFECAWQFGHPVNTCFVDLEKTFKFRVEFKYFRVLFTQTKSDSEDPFGSAIKGTVHSAQDRVTGGPNLEPGLEREIKGQCLVISKNKTVFYQ